MAPAHLRRKYIMTERSPDALVSIRNHGHTDARSANQYAATIVSLSDRLCQFMGDLRVIAGSTTENPHVRNGIFGIFFQTGTTNLFQFKSGMIRTNRNIHTDTLFNHFSSVTVFTNEIKARQGSKALKIREAFVPPKPKEFDMAARTFTFLETFGT